MWCYCVYRLLQYFKTIEYMKNRYLLGGFLYMKSYGETIREGLIKKNMSQQALADVLEVSQKTVSRYIHNEVNIPNDKRDIINNVLGIESEICYNRHAAVDAIYNILLSVHSSDRLCILGDVLKKMSSDSVQI